MKAVPSRLIPRKLAANLQSFALSMQKIVIIFRILNLMCFNKRLIVFWKPWQVVYGKRNYDP